MDNEFRDHLTHVLNRAGLYNYYKNLSGNTSYQLLFFDIDNFKTINDIYGHQSGDEALVRFSQVLTSNAPDNSIVVRLGGDEFIMLISGDMTYDDVSILASSIISGTRALKKENRIFEVISCSIGILTNISSSTSLDDALNLADKAMYFAKEAGKDTFVFYSDFEDKIKYEADIEKNAVHALDEGQFQIYYHPTLHLQSSRLIRTEACCVWIKPDGTMLGRNDFRPILEKNGFIKEIDLYIFEKVCKDLAKFKSLSDKYGVIGVQLSYLHILDEHLSERLCKIMDKYGVSASELDINLDENAFGKRTATSKIISNLNKLSNDGFSISLSKFGEDFSSVRYLSKLPIYSLKFDGEFISEHIENDTSARALRSATELGKCFKFRTIACDVNDYDSMRKIERCGFDAASGDYFCKKLPLDEYIEYINSNIHDDNATISYRFNGTLLDDNGGNEASILGEGISFTDGITKSWCGVKLPGGPINTNLIELPLSLFDCNDYTVSMWIKPCKAQDWTSAIYVRYIDGFMSFMPNIPGGRSAYRSCEDAILDKWNDALSGAFAIDKWIYASITYDSFTQTGRLYINGELAATVADAPTLKSPQSVCIGGDLFQKSFDGFISGLQFDNCPLTGEDIMRRYQSFIDEGIDDNINS